jgi:hypothetical protein
LENITWKAGAKALAAFQQATYAAGKSGKAQGRAFSSLKDIIKTIRDNSENLGLSHAETWHPLGTDHATLRVTLYHESGESIYSELPVDITQKNRSGSREQAQGSAMTYARRYLLLGIYGLANDDEDDDGEATTATANAVKAPAPQPAAKDVAIQQQQPTTAPVEGLSGEGKKNALRIIKANPDIKAQFVAKFYSSRADGKIFPDDVYLKEHGEFLEQAELAATENIPF